LEQKECQTEIMAYLGVSYFGKLEGVLFLATIWQKCLSLEYLSNGYILGLIG